MKSFFSITLFSCLLAMFVFSDLTMGQVFRNYRQQNRPPVESSKAVYADGIKLSVDAPLELLKNATEGHFDKEDAKKPGFWDDSVGNAAKFYLGQCYLLGYNGCPKNEEQADEYFDDIFDSLGIGYKNFERWTGLGIPSAGRNQRIALPPPTNESFNDLMAKYITRIRQEAEKGNTESQIKLGKYYVLGMGVQNNPQEAAKWIRRAAEQGDADAQETLAMFYAEGFGVRVSRAEFKKWYDRSEANWNRGDYGKDFYEGEYTDNPKLVIVEDNDTSSSIKDSTPSITTTRRMSLERGDIILEVNGERIIESGDLSNAVNRSPQTMYLTVRDRRNGNIVKFVTTLNSSRPRLGVTGQPQPGGGARITQVDRNSPATRCYVVE